MAEDAPDAGADGEERAGTRWLSIDAACRLLGVDQSTLRRWSDAGKIPVFRTPGGHRRYSEDDLRAFQRGESRPRRRMSRRVLTDLSFSAYATDYIRQARARPWYRAYGPAQLEELRVLGRRLVDLAVRSISGRADRAQILEEAQAIGRRYGTLGAAAGLSASDAVEAFLFFRFPVIQAAARFIEETDVPAKRAAHLFAEITQFLDQVLVATVAAHAEAA
ncbi:MAG TPA: helix-turn-helix domain-containing protein [Thermomicrobiaceae bacterium]|nr:helix-turn-helix domain-containing protein [Thermomicrobiaceae bacterium]